LIEIERELFAAMRPKSKWDRVVFSEAISPEYRDPRKNYDRDAAWLKVVGVEVSKVISELMTKGPRQTFDEELSDENFAERELSFEERIDAKIAKRSVSTDQARRARSDRQSKSIPSSVDCTR
jgi:hypothetical protein